MVLFWGLVALVASGSKMSNPNTVRIEKYFEKVVNFFAVLIDEKKLKG